MKYFHRTFTCVLVLCIVATVGFAQLTSSRDGKVDPSFGNSGITAVSVDPNLDFAGVVDLEIAPDGKIVVLGFFQPSGQRVSGLYRFLPNGQIDTSFGENGLVLLDELPWHVGFAIKVQPDNKVVLAGYKDLRTGSPTFDLMMLRLNADGSLDTSFGTNGIFLKDLSVGKLNAADELYSLVFQTDGKIVASGTSDRISGVVGQDRNLVVIRLTGDGVLDPSFGDNGTFQTPAGKAHSQTFGSRTATALRSDGKILVGISYGVYLSAEQTLPSQFSDLFSLNSNGTTDSSFSSDGKLELGQGFDNFQSIHVLPNGKLRTLSGLTRISQIDTSGNLDAGFGTGGHLIASPYYSGDMAVDGSERSVITAITDTGIFRRFLNNGELDIKFGRGGIGTTNGGAPYTYASKLGITDSGDLVMAGIAGPGKRQLIITRHFGKRKL
ncbi:MAG: hypothetical protein HOP17_09440 [Acidobacteria bacterium]|nr:hypothetical protein [Acidobacteriota bacterium]